MKAYLDILQEALDQPLIPNRTGTDAGGVFGRQMRFDLSEGFPMVTTKKVAFRLIAHELLWFLSGSTNIKYLLDNNVHIWDEWADEQGELGPVYGSQWRSWPAPDGRRIDQIAQVIDSLRHNPHGRRHIISAWNPAEIDRMALPPCHLLFQFHVDAEKRLHCQLYQRSCDLFLGVPFNIASYALLTHMVAQVTGLAPGVFVHTLGDAHVYENHRDAVRAQLQRDPKPLPQLQLNPDIDNILDFGIDDITLSNYQCHGALKGAVAV